MIKAFTLHENEYRRMAAQGVRSWDERPWASGNACAQEIDPGVKTTLETLFSKDWMPRGGRALEIGCGTAPLLRWVCRRGFEGCGVDVSETAIAMARSQSADYPVRLECGDFCQMAGLGGQYDLIIDGHCLHCVTGQRDRESYLRNAFARLRPGGIFILLSMCGPVNLEVFHGKYPDQMLRDDTIYYPFDWVDPIEGVIEADGRRWLPTRHVGHWRAILDEVERQGFEPLYALYNAGAADESLGALAAACRRPAPATLS